MGDAGLASARERFSAERMLKETLRVYQRVALHADHDDGTRLVAARELLGLCEP